MSNDDVKLDTKNLDKLLQALAKPPVAKVGILGSTNQREDKKSNATIGMKHEFGSEHLPERSFIRMPLNTKLAGALDAAGAFDQKAIDQIVDKSSLDQYVEKMGQVGVDVIQDAFATGGFGNWKPSDMKYKKVHQTLVETQQLRDSITWELKKAE